MRDELLAVLVYHFPEHTYSICGILCCRTCFQLFHNVTKHNVEDALRLCKHGKSVDRRLSGVDPDAHHGRPRRIGLEIEHWMAHWLAVHVQVTPGTGRHLVFHPIVMWVYHEYLHDCASTGSAAGSYTEFLSIYHTQLTGIRVPRSMLDRKRCSDCYLFMLAIRRAVLRNDSEKVAELKERLRVHNVLQYDARQDFYRRREYAPEHSDEFTLLAADGTFAVLFPTVPQDSSFKRAMPKLTCNVFTVVDYSHPADRDHIFLSIGADGSEDANSEISFIHAHIQRLRNAGQLAARLELQLDNGPSGKNRWMLAYLAALIAWGWVKEVLVYFLIVGHTHEHIDSVPGQIRTPQRWGLPCWSLNEFFNRWPQFFRADCKPSLHLCVTAPGSADAFANYQRPVVSVLRNWKSLLTPCMRPAAGFSRDVSLWRIDQHGTLHEKGLVTEVKWISSTNPLLHTIPQLVDLHDLNFGVGNTYAPNSPAAVIAAIVESLEQLGDVVEPKDLQDWRNLQACFARCKLPDCGPVKGSDFSVSDLGVRITPQLHVGTCASDFQ